MATYQRGSVKLFFRCDSHLKAYYNFNSLIDYSGKAETLTNVNNVLLNNKSFVASLYSASFNGANYLKFINGVPNFRNDSVGTIMCWFKYRDSGHNIFQSFFGFDIENKRIYFWKTSNNKIYFELAYRDVYTCGLEGTTILKPNNWYLYTFHMTNNGGFATLNGKEEILNNIGDDIDLRTNRKWFVDVPGTSFDTTLGTRFYYGSPYNYLDGFISEFAIFSIPLSSKDIQSYYKWATGQKKIFLFSDEILNPSIIRRRLLVK